jgi:secretion/DNA translocation related CpaE-like protein
MRYPTEVTGQGSDGRGWVLGVVGASGGVGASSVAAAVAVRAAAAGRTVLAVDGCPWGAGLDLRLGMDQAAGLRWPELTGMRGVPDGSALVQELPQQGALAVLSWDRGVPTRLPTRPDHLVAALAPARDLVVCDLPAAGDIGVEGWWAACDAVVLVVGGSLDCFAAAGVVADALDSIAGLVVRRDRHSVPAERVAAALGHPVLAELGIDPRVAADLVRGAAVGGHGALAACADSILAALLPDLREVA